MVDRRRNESYKNISGYILISLIEKVKMIARGKGITQNEALEKALELWVKENEKEPDSIHELVALNIKKLEQIGIPKEKLIAIARGGLLPTQPDFCEIVTALEVSIDLKEKLWRKAYGRKDFNNDEKQHSKYHQQP